MQPEELVEKAATITMTLISAQIEKWARREQMQGMVNGGSGGKNCAGFAGSVNIEYGKNIDTKVIMLTAKSEEQDELKGFELGVDEYITKPFSPKILVARIEALLRRSNKLNSEEVITSGIIEFNKAAHSVTVNGDNVELSHKEFELLEYFIEVCATGSITKAAKSLSVSPQAVSKAVYEMAAKGLCPAHSLRGGEVTVMRDWFIAALAGAVTGILSGFGIGGGSLLLIYMTSFAGVPQNLAQGINLLYFLPAAATASFQSPYRNRNGASSIPPTCITTSTVSC